jgi:transcriptional regulator with XRE-family HTH domain
MKKNTPVGNTTAVTPETLATWRDRMGFSQRDACNALGCSRGAWARWEEGTQRIPRYIGLACAALALGMSAYGDDRMKEGA